MTNFIDTNSCGTLEDLAQQTQEALESFSVAIEVGAVTTVPYGDPPTIVDVSEVPGIIKYDWGIPEGSPGVTPLVTVADPVIVLPAGSTPIVTDINVNPVHVELQFSLPAGIEGQQGEIGITPTITIGDTSTLSAGSNATVVDVSDPGDLTTVELEFGIPQGYDGGGGGTGVTTKQFLLKENMLLGDESASVELLNDDGTTTGTITEINDHEGKFHGLAAYTGADGTAQRAFRGTATQYESNSANWFIHSLEGKFPAILVQLQESVAGGTGPFDSTYTTGYGSNGGSRIPQQTSSNTISVYNTDNTGDKGTINEFWFCTYDPVSDKYELAFPVNGSRTEVVLAVTTIGGAEITTTQITCGTGVGSLMEKDGDNYTVEGSSVNLLNTSVTPIVATVAEPIGLLCAYDQGKYIVLNVMDFRSGPGYVTGTPQRWIHQDADAGQGTFELMDICQNNIVTDVYKSSSGLYVSWKLWDSCLTGVTKLFDFGPCTDETQPEVQSEGSEDPWRDTGFWN